MIFSLLVMLAMDLAYCRLHYPEVFMSNYCNELGTETFQLGSIDSKTVTILRSTPGKLECELIRSCSIKLKPAPGHALLVNPILVKINHSIGILSVSMDGKQVWTWSSDANISKSTPIYKSSQKNKPCLIEFNAINKASIWRHASFEMIITSYIPVKSDNSSLEEECPPRFYFNCGNKKCIRTGLLCDGIANCENNEDEMACGLKTSPLIIISSFVCLTVGFVAFLSFLQKRADKSLKDAKKPTIRVKYVK